MKPVDYCPRCKGSGFICCEKPIFESHGYPGGPGEQLCCGEGEECNCAEELACAAEAAWDARREDAMMEAMERNPK